LSLRRTGKYIQGSDGERQKKQEKRGARHRKTNISVEEKQNKTEIKNIGLENEKKKKEKNEDGKEKSKRMAWITGFRISRN
jgi:hypothetical protein